MRLPTESPARRSNWPVCRAVLPLACDSDHIGRGDALYCEMRGETAIAGMTAARIAWPRGKYGRNPAIIVCGDLVRALKRESACAVIHSWGVGKTLVNQWRRALGVPKLTEGDRLVRAENGRSPGGGKALRAMWAKAQDPERRRKIAAAHRGKPKPPHVIEAVRRVNLGRRRIAAERRRMSELMKRLGRRPPVGELWKPSQDRLVRTLPLVGPDARCGPSIIDAARLASPSQSRVGRRRRSIR